MADSVYRELWETITDGRSWEGQFINKKKDETFYTEVARITPLQSSSGEITNFVAVKRDITKELELQKQFIQSQRMEAIGLLAGGIAHDFNNILTVIIGNLELIAYLQKTKGLEPDEQVIDSMNAAHRAKDLVSQILTFSRKADVDKLPMDIGPICKETLKLVRSSFPSTIDIKQNIPNGLPRVVADPTLVHQIIMNLCTNSLHALKDQTGTITVTLGTCSTSLRQLESQNKTQSHGQCPCLEVSDTGSGIPKDAIEQIFLPYFTTKPQGEGTGLGLSVVHGIVKELGGDITVQSVVDEGTTFTITLPVLDYKEKHQALHDNTIPSGSGRILIVDNEPQIVNILGRILKKIGYKSVVAYDGESVRAILTEESDRINLIITDYTMPKQNGIELVKVFKQINKDIPIILMTGFQIPLIEKKALNAGIDAIIRKPLSIVNIAEVVKQYIRQ